VSRSVANRRWHYGDSPVTLHYLGNGSPVTEIVENRIRDPAHKWPCNTQVAERVGT
jgi:hypothetical protein